MTISIWSVMAALCLAGLAPPPAVAQKVENFPAAKIAQAFEEYERIRTALSADSLKGVKEAATALAPLAKDLGGDDAGAAATKLAAATAIKDARTHFGDLSDALVPTLLAAEIPGVHGFSCAMVKKPWAQKGDKTQNPYYGKSMPTCGVPMKVKAGK